MAVWKGVVLCSLKTRAGISESFWLSHAKFAKTLVKSRTIPISTSELPLQQPSAFKIARDAIDASDILRILSDHAEDDVDALRYAILSDAMMAGHGGTASRTMRIIRALAPTFFLSEDALAVKTILKTMHHSGCHAFRAGN
jgi:hypothetical protein